MEHTVTVDGLRVRSYTGLYDEEKVLGNEIEVSAWLTAPAHTGIIDYEQVCTTITELLKTPHTYLEIVNTTLIERLRAQFPQAIHIIVETGKLSPHFIGRMDKVSVKTEWLSKHI